MLLFEYLIIIFSIQFDQLFIYYRNMPCWINTIDDTG